MLLLALVTLASSAVALGARHERRASAPTLVRPGLPVTATSDATTVAPGPRFSTTVPQTTARTTAPRTAAPQPTISTGTLPVAPGAPSTVAKTAPAPAKTTTTAARPPAPGAGSWPSGVSGWTDILESLPESSTGHAEALASAHRAARAGLTEVGVLRSSDHSSLRAGYWVVYAGVFTSRAAAESALATASTHGFSGSYPARVTR